MLTTDLNFHPPLLLCASHVLVLGTIKFFLICSTSSCERPHFSTTYCSTEPCCSRMAFRAPSMFSGFAPSMRFAPSGFPWSSGLFITALRSCSLKSPSPASVRLYSRAMVSSSTPQMDKTKAQTTPVLSLPAVQWTSNGEGSGLAR